MKRKPCPTQGGQLKGYKIEYFINNDWKPVPTEIVKAGKGVPYLPYPIYDGGILNTIGLFGYEQAKAIAWHGKAVFAASPLKRGIRIVEYIIKYDIKAYQEKIEEIK